MRTSQSLLRRKRFRITAAAFAVLAIAAGVFYSTGAYDSWQDGRALSRACGGIIPQEELRQYLGVDGRLTSDRPWKSSVRDDRSCVIYAPEGPEHAAHASLMVTLGQGRSSLDLLTDLDRNESYGFNAVSPIGNGWRGVLGEVRATVVMPCGRGARDDLVVNVLADSRLSGRKDGPSSPGQRARLARIATQTTANAAEQAGCKASPGNTIDRVPDAVTVYEPRHLAVPAGKATGTCAGVNVPTLETAADPLAPIEDCFIVDKADEPVFRLAAYYGPFVQKGRANVSARGDMFTPPAGGSDGLYWTSTACPKQGGTAFYSVETLRSGDVGFTKPAPTSERSALARFAERSARSHGCHPGFAHTSTH